MREHGWLNLCFEFSSLKVELRFSSVFDPIPSFLDWIQSILEKCDSSIVEIDEEGLFKRLFFERLHPLDRDRFMFRIVSDRNFPYHEYEFTKVVSRTTFLTTLLAALGRLSGENTERIWVNYNLSDTINIRLKDFLETLEKETASSQQEKES